MPAAPPRTEVSFPSREPREGGEGAQRLRFVAQCIKLG
jgi:hypothetical protein